MVSFKGHISGSSSKTANAENGMFLPGINKEKVKIYADTDNIFLSGCVANTFAYFIKISITYASRILLSIEQDASRAKNRKKMSLNGIWSRRMAQMPNHFTEMMLA